MLIGQVSGLASAGSTVDKTFFYQIRLIHLFHSTGILTYGGSYRTKSHRAAIELVDNGIEYLVVDRVKSALVDIQCIEGIGSYLQIDETGALDLREIPDPAQKRIGYTGLRIAISIAALSSISMLRMEALRLMIFFNTGAS